MSHGPEPEVPGGIAGTVGVTMKVLIIEYDRHAQMAVSLHFQVHGPAAQLISTHLGEEGIELAAAERPDMVILDLGFPCIGALKVLKQVRVFSSVPVVIPAAAPGNGDAKTAPSQGLEAFEDMALKHAEFLKRVRTPVAA